MNKRQPRILRGVTRTVRMTILSREGGPVDLSLARKVTATVSLDGAGKSDSYTPAFVVGGEYNNVVSFVWFADMQQRCGRYTFEVVADYGDRNQARINWHREWGVELVEYNSDEGGSLPETLDLDAYIDLTGSVSMNGVGMSAYEQWLASDYSEGYEKSVDGFMTWLQRPATDAENRVIEELGSEQESVPGDGTMWGEYRAAEILRNEAYGAAEQHRDGEYSEAEQQRDSSYDEAEQHRDDEYSEAEQQRDGSYDEAELHRDGEYSEAEQQRDSSYDEAELHRDGEYSEAEQQRDDSYDEAELHRDGEYSEAEQQRDSSYEEAEGSEESSLPGDGSRWGAHKQAELDRQQAMNNKADKDTDAVAGNVAEFDANGNAVDSGVPVREIGEIDWREDKVSPVTYASGNISKTDGSVVTSTAWEHAVIQLGNAKRVRFMGNVYQNVSSWAGGYAFYDANGDTIAVYTFDSAAANSPKEYVVIVPPGAKTFKTPVYIGTSPYNVTREEDFYCYLQVGDTLADSLLSPITKFDLIGTGNTTAKKELPDLVGGHRYRLYINDWDITDIYTSGNYLLLYVYAAGIKTYLFNEYVNVSERLPYYDFIVPADCSGKVVIGIRAAAGSVVKLRLEDITVAYAEIKERKQADYEKGLTVTYDFNDLIEYEKVYADKWIYSRASSLYNDVSTTNSTSYPINVKIPLPAGIKRIKYTAFNTQNEWGSVVLDENEKVVDVYNNSGSSNVDITLNVPSSAKYLIYSIRYDMRKTVTLELSKYADDDRIDFLSERLKTAKVITGETTTLYRNTSDFSVLFEKYNYGQYYAAGTSLGQNIADVIHYKSHAYSNYLIPVEGWKQVGIRQFKTTGYYGSLFLNANMVVVGGVYNTSDNRDVVVNVPAGSKWLLYSSGVFNDDYVTFYAGDTMESAIEQLDTRIDDLVESNSSVSQRTGAVPRYRSGIITAQGGITENAKYITTEPIFGNFALGVADGFLIFSGTLVDRNGNVVSHEHIPPMSDITAAQLSWSARLTFSSLNMPAEYGYRLVICKADGTDITDDDTIITTFIAMGDAPVKRWIPDGLANYDVAQRRIEYMQRLLWTPLLKVPDGSDSSYDTNTYFCLPGHLMTNVPYSDLGLTRKFVPSNVSIRTFLTAAKNKRSLLYTENLFSKTSGYGLSYTGAFRCGSYYGCACNAFTAWVMGLKTVYLSGDYNSNDVPGLSTVSNPSADNVQPLDLIWNQGHISIISDVFKDDYGKVKFVVWAEMTTPYAKRTIYTAEQFEARLTDKSCTVHRWNGWSGITEPPTVPGYNLYQIGGADCDVPYCEDIMCFAGDYASFASGEKVFLNARRGGTYTGVELYKDDVLLDTIDITELAVDGSDGEDWVRVDLGTSLAAGKYKARLTDGTNTTGYTYFEVIGITFSASPGNGNITLQFSATGGTPVSLEGCGSSGFAYYFHPITAEDIQAGSVTKSWSSTSNNVKLYLLVQGDYGTVCKIIDYPTA